MSAAIILIHGRGPKPAGDSLLKCWKQFLPASTAVVPVSMVLWVDLFEYQPTYQPPPVECRDIAENDLPDTTAQALRASLSEQDVTAIQREATAEALSFRDFLPIRDAIVDRIWTDFVAISQNQFAIDARNFFQVDPKLRITAKKRLSDAIVAASGSGHAVMVISHSFGTIVAYEVARELQQREIHTLVTMGSPLAWCYDMWGPAAPPAQPGRYMTATEFPRFGLRKWWNVYDPSDVTATAKVLAAAPQLGPKYQLNGNLPVIIDTPIRNTYATPRDWGSPHDYRGYLASQPVKQAIETFLLEAQ